MFLEEPPASERRDTIYEEKIEDEGFVWTLTKLWAWTPDASDKLDDLMDQLTMVGSLSFRDRGILVSATASTIDNSGCALAWGNRLNKVAGLDTAVSVLKGEESAAMTERDRALSRWARKVARGPTQTTQADVDELRAIGMSDAEILATTFYVGLRIAFSAVNDALDAPLDEEATKEYPKEIVAAVDFGRPLG